MTAEAQAASDRDDPANIRSVVVLFDLENTAKPKTIRRPRSDTSLPREHARALRLGLIHLRRYSSALHNLSFFIAQQSGGCCDYGDAEAWRQSTDSPCHPFIPQTTEHISAFEARTLLTIPGAYSRNKYYKAERKRIRT